MYHAIDNPLIVQRFHKLTGLLLNILISYNFLPGNAYKLTKLYRHMIDSLALDSGAYSVYTGKANVTPSEYRRYIRRFGHLFDVIFSLDKDFNNPYDNFTTQYYLQMELPEQVRKPIPVIHDPVDPFGEFKTYADDGHTYIAIGSGKPVPDKVLHKMKTEYPDVKIHMFGKLNRKMLLEHKPYSADASTWAIAAGNGCFYYWDEEEKKEYTIYVGDSDKTPPGKKHFNQFQNREGLEKFLREKFGWTFKDLLSGPVENKRILNLYFFRQLEDLLKK